MKEKDEDEREWRKGETREEFWSVCFNFADPIFLYFFLLCSVLSPILFLIGNKAEKTMSKCCQTH